MAIQQDKLPNTLSQSPGKEYVVIHQGQQDSRKEPHELIAEAQAARVQAHVRSVLARLTGRRTKLLKAA